MRKFRLGECVTAQLPESKDIGLTAISNRSPSADSKEVSDEPNPSSLKAEG